MRYFLSVILLAALCTCVRAQTTLAPGDLAFTLLNTDAPDAFAFVLLTDVEAGTTFNVTDKEYSSQSGLGNNEGILLISFTAAATCGSEFLFTSATSNGSFTAGTVSGTGTATATAASGTVQLSSSGESLIAYQGTTYLTILQKCGRPFSAGNVSACSDLPPGLTDGLNAFAYTTGSPSDNPDNIKYDCSLTAGTQAALGTALSTLANWEADDATAIAYGSGCGFTCTDVCSEPTINGIAVIPDPTCTGTSATIGINGNLNGASRWVIYEGSCGGTEVATGTSSPLDFIPSASGTYYLAGIDGCVVTPTCTSFEVTLTGTAAAVAEDLIFVDDGTNTTTISPAPPENGQIATLVFVSGDGLGTITGPTEANEWTISGTAGRTYRLRYEHVFGTCPTTSDEFTVVFANNTPLTAGDIAFTGINTDAPDGFSLLALRDIDAGTTITFTDRGWDGGFLSPTSESTMQLTLWEPWLCRQGIYLSEGAEDALIQNWTVRRVNDGSIVGQLTQVGPEDDFQLSTSGDQVFAYQGEAPTAASQGNFLAGISTNCSTGGCTSAGWDAAINSTGSDSKLPTALTGFALLLSPTDSDNETDNGQFDCTQAGTTEPDLSQLLDLDNWMTDVTNAFDLSASCIEPCDRLPVAVCQDIVVDLDANGMPTVGGQPFQASDLDGGSTDDGTIMSYAVDITPGCDNLLPTFDAILPFGATAIQLTVTDDIGQTAACTAQVTVRDDLPPTIACQNIVIDLDADGEASAVSVAFSSFGVLVGFSDNCASAAGAIVSGTQLEFTCNDLGDNPETFGFNDGYKVAPGNETTCEAVVQINDPLGVCGTPPVAICAEFNAGPDPDGTYTLDANSLDAGSTDDRSVYTLAFTDETSIVSNDVSNRSLIRNALGQSFTATQTGSIQAINVRSFGARSGVTLHIYAGDMGSGEAGMVGTPAYTQTGVGLFGSPDGARTRILLDVPFPVVDGQQYSFILEGDSELYANTLTPGLDPYPEGEALVNFSESLGGDLDFSVELIGPTLREYDREGRYLTILWAVDDQGNVSEESCRTFFVLDVAFPVELLSFTGRADAKVNELQWAVAAEDNFRHYLLERTANPAGTTAWEVLATLPGDGGPAYAHTDREPLPSAYYRLKMVDQDGTFRYSDVIFLERGAAAGAVRVFPNPSTGNFTVRLPESPEALALSLRDLTGREIVSRRTTARNWSPDLLLPAGVYLLAVTDGEQRWTKRVVIR